MTQKTFDRVKIAWEVAKGVGIGLGVFIGTGILTYQKKTYDWQINQENRMNNAERINSTQDMLISNRQDYEGRNDKTNGLQDKQITFLFGHFGIPLIQN